MERSFFELDFMSRYGYDAKIDYGQIIDKYNRLIEQGNEDEAVALIRQHGGVLAVLGKLDYQKGRQK